MSNAGVSISNFVKYYWHFFVTAVIVHPMRTMTLWRNDCLNPIHQYWVPFIGFHSAIVISHDVVTPTYPKFIFFLKSIGNIGRSLMLLKGSSYEVRINRDIHNRRRIIVWVSFFANLLLLHLKIFWRITLKKFQITGSSRNKVLVQALDPASAPDLTPRILPRLVGVWPP